MTKLEQAAVKESLTVQSSDHIAGGGKVILPVKAAQQIEEALANIQITGPDADDVLWINLPGNGTTGKAILRVGKEGLIASQCAKLFNEQRTEAIATIRAARAQEQAEQEPVPTGATHYQPHQKTYYKRVSATEWYLWSCTGKGWLPSKGTSDSSEWIMLSPIQAHQPAKPAEQEPTSKTKALDYAILTLHSIACLTQGDNLLWWQKSARNVLAKIDELLREQSVATYQEPASRAILCPPPPPEVYKMRSRDAFEAGWWEAQRQKAVSPISPVQQAEQEPVAWALSHSMGLEFGSKYPMQETKEAAEQMARQHMGAVVVTPLYAAPVRTKDLTDDEILQCGGMDGADDWAFKFARAVIAADREKNK